MYNVQLIVGKSGDLSNQLHLVLLRHFIRSCKTSIPLRKRHARVQLFLLLRPFEEYTILVYMYKSGIFYENGRAP